MQVPTSYRQQNLDESLGNEAKVHVQGVAIKL